MVKVRKFHQSTGNRFGAGGKKCRGSLNTVIAPDVVVFVLQDRLFLWRKSS